jgi:hypothetical protein
LDWFDNQYKPLMDKYKFRPQLMFNLDETMVRPLKPRVKVVTRSDEPQPCFDFNEKEPEHVTLLLTVSASGQALDPLIIFPLKHVPALPEDLQSEFLIAGQKNGWMEGPIFNNMLFNHIVPAIDSIRTKHKLPPSEPALILYDGSSTHNDLDIDTLRDKHNIHVLLLPPHSSAMLQPLDLTVNGVFKQALTKRFKHLEKEDAQTRRVRMVRAISDSLSIAQARAHITDGWRRAGLLPIDVNIPLSSGMLRVEPKPDPAPKPAGQKRGLKCDAGRIVHGSDVTFPPAKKAKIDSQGSDAGKQDQSRWNLLFIKDCTVRLKRG